MTRSGFLLIVFGTLAVLATSASICLEVVTGVYAESKSKLLITCSISAAFESVMLLVFGALGLSQGLRTKKLPMSWTSSRPAFICQLFGCTAAFIPSAVSLAYLREWTTNDDGGLATDRHQKLFIGSAIAVSFATIFQFGFIIFHFLASRDITLGTASSFHSSEEGRKMNIKSIRYSRTFIGTKTQEMATATNMESSLATPENPSMGPIDFLKASMSQAIRPTSSRTKLLESQRRRPKSSDSMPIRKSSDTSFDSWDTSSVDAHNRQVVMEMSSPTTLKRGLETIPASPSGSRSPSRPGTPLDMELEPPRMLYRAESYSSSILSQQDLRRLTPDSSVNELHIHPLFRSDSPTPPPTASPGTSVLAAPHAGRVISRQSSMQSMRRLRSGSLPAAHSPLIRQTSLDSLKLTKLRDDGDVGRKSADPQSERKMTPPVPEWLLSPAMKASLESFKEQKQEDGEEK